MNQNTLMNVLIAALILLVGFGVYYLINIGNQHVTPSKRIHFHRNRIFRLTAIVLGVVGFLILLRYNPIIRSVLFAIVFAVVMAYILNPLVVWLEKKGLKRPVAILLIYLVIAGVLVFLFVLVLPRTVEETTKFLRALPGLLTTGTSNLLNFLDQQFGAMVDLEELTNRVNQMINDSIGTIQQTLFNFAGSVTGYLGGLFTRIVGIFIFPIITYYFLNDKEKFTRLIVDAIPANRKQGMSAMAKDIDISLSQFVRGRLLMAVFVGVTTTIFLFIFKIEFAIVIGLITGIADIIPYIGPFMGFLPAVLLALMQGPVAAVRIAIVFVLIQWVENNLLGPKLLGDSTGLHPFVVLMCLVIGGSLFGFLGMIFSVPIVSAARIIWIYYKDSVHNRKLN